MEGTLAAIVMNHFNDMEKNPIYCISTVLQPRLLFSQHVGEYHKTKQNAFYSNDFIPTVPDSQSVPHCFCHKDRFSKLKHLYRETGAAGGVQRRGRGTSGRTTCQKTSEGTSWQRFGLFDELANEQESTSPSHLGATTIARGRPPIAAPRG